MVNVTVGYVCAETLGIMATKAMSSRRAEPTAAKPIVLEAFTLSLILLFIHASLLTLREFWLRVVLVHI
jgi:hypothetical protein